MNTAELNYLLNHPNSITATQAETLEKVLREYPYFQSARCLHLKALQKEDNFKYTSALKLTAIHTTDRSVLHDFVTHENFGIDFSVKTSTQQNEALEVTPTTMEKPTVKESTPEVTEAEVNTTEDEQETSSTAHKLEQAVLSSIQITEEQNIITPAPSESQDESITLDNPLEQSVLNSILIANEKSVEVETPSTPKLSLETPLSQSILSSIKEATESTEEKPKVIAELHKEKTSWLEDSLDTDLPIVVSETPVTITDTTAPSEQPTPPSQEEESSQNATTLSFQEWLQVAKIKPIERVEIENTEVGLDKNTTVAPHPSSNSAVSEEKDHDSAPNIEAENQTATASKMDLIDKFIETNPKIAPVKDNIPPPSYIAKKPDSPYLMTETLAKIYLEQKKYTKAIQAYEILILKYPEKSSLFADRILDIKELQQNNNR